MIIDEAFLTKYQGRIFDIPDEPRTGLKRRVWAYGHMVNEKSEQVVQFNQVHFFERLPDGSYGPEVRNRVVRPLERPMVADSRRMVNPLNGVPCNETVENGQVVYRDLSGTLVTDPVPHYHYLVPAMLVNPITINGQVSTHSAFYESVVNIGVIENSFD